MLMTRTLLATVLLAALVPSTTPQGQSLALTNVLALTNADVIRFGGDASVRPDGDAGPPAAPGYKSRSAEDRR